MTDRPEPVTPASGADDGRDGPGGPMAGALRLLDRAIESLLGIVLGALVAIGAAQVITRYLWSAPLAWAMELSIVAMVWATMLAGYVGVRRNVHLSADFIGLRFAPSVRWWLESASLAASLLFVVLVGWTGRALIDAMDGIPFASLPFTQPVLYWSLPTGAVLMIVALLARIAGHLARRPADG